MFFWIPLTCSFYLFLHMLHPTQIYRFQSTSRSTFHDSWTYMIYNRFIYVQKWEILLKIMRFLSDTSDIGFFLCNMWHGHFVKTTRDMGPPPIKGPYTAPCHSPASKEGVLLRNVSAAPICNHFAVVPPSSRIREPVPFLVWSFQVWGGGGVKWTFNDGLNCAVKCRNWNSSKVHTTTLWCSQSVQETYFQNSPPITPKINIQ